MEYQTAKRIASSVIEKLESYCSRIEVAGSIRRKKGLVNDIDLVLIAEDPWRLHAELSKMGTIVAGGDKLIRVRTATFQLDIYMATSETWATLLLIRTGSKENNIRLCSRAKEMGWHLAANGDGLFNESGRRIAGDTELSIYNALGLPWQRPEERG